MFNSFMKIRQLQSEIRDLEDRKLDAINRSMDLARKYGQKETECADLRERLKTAEDLIERLGKASTDMNDELREQHEADLLYNALKACHVIPDTGKKEDLFTRDAAIRLEEKRRKERYAQLQAAANAQAGHVGSLQGQYGAPLNQLSPKW